MSSPPGSPRRQSEISSFRGAEPKRKPRGKPKRGKSPDKTLPFFEKGRFDDVTLVVGDKQLYSNSCLLSYNSSKFMQVLSDDNVGKGKGKTAASKDLDLSHHTFGDVCALLSFIDPRVPYDLTDEDAFRLLPIAEEYDIAPLKKASERTVTESFLKKRRGRRAGCVPTDETIRHLGLADKYQLKDLHEMCCIELVANDNPLSSNMVSASKDLSEHAKLQVLEKKVDKLNMALARARRINTEKEQAKDTRGSTLWKK
ncbi:uncharacterized protein LOC123546840 [Mercenaria mercenaria]|uniref:uncharacterized protein LOC123546840 n=1 Tax=Mercenaria mercenaria TaxID=6596 RepID=UPI001E1DD0AC|nr:uncharacterized protein LOC123546840 [Mercenaria mercenaria]XP_045189379.1 uncharacterized protein LOC123546840 [Mercenaria mercenaria]